MAQKVFEFAKEQGIETLILMDKIRKWGDLSVKSHMATLDEDTIQLIRERLESESGAKKKKKKVTKKASSSKKKTTAKKKVAKKAATKKTTVKRATTAKTAAAETSESAAKKTAKKVTKKKTVIRRTAQSIKEEAEAATVLAAKEAEAAAQASAEQQSEPSGGETPAPAETVTTEATTAPEVKRPKNIVGRMDLSRVRGATRPSSAGAGGSSGDDRGATSKPRATGPRNIRPGFIHQAPVAAPVTEDRGRNDDKAPKKKAGAAGKEVPQKTFTATEFRKREVIFQPKKKKPPTVMGVKKTQLTTPKAHKRIVKVHGTIKVSDLADQMNIKTPQLTKKLMSEGIMVKIHSDLDFDTVSLIAPEFGYEAQNVYQSVDDLLGDIAFGDLEAEKVIRPPVVTVMGHVDHGKTTLLDAIRSADVVSGEAGGITQHIGAYRVTLGDGKVATFIDTPGHAAFTAMRARGANVTDIIILVVAADDGMMPQTEEAISHAKAAGVPIIVAINKMDRPGANPEKIKQQLAEHELVPEDWGGETICVPVSALKREGIQEILEQIHLVAEVQELKANPKQSGTGIVIESRQERGRGNVATVLITEGSVEKGQNYVAGTVSGRIRSMFNDQGKVIKAAGPGEPVEIIGLPSVAEAGDRFDICKDEDAAERVAAQRLDEKEKEKVPSSKMSLEEIFSKVSSGDVQELSVVLKTDVAGTAEAIKGMFDKLATEEVKVKVIHSGVGGIGESDILLASTANGIVIGFNVRPDNSAQRLAKEKCVDIKMYSVIYHLTDDIKKAMSGLLRPDIVEKSMGRAEVRETFTVPKMGMIAGCSVTDGKISRADLLRLIRDGKVVYEGRVSSLRRFKDDVKEVANGYECGIGIENFNDIKVGDEIEAFVKEEVAREL